MKRALWLPTLGITMGFLALLSGCFGSGEAPDKVAKAPHILAVDVVAWAPNGRAIVCDANKKWHSISLPEGQITSTIEGLGRAANARISDDGRFLAAIASPKSVQVWRLRDGKLIANLDCQPSRSDRLTALAIAPDGKYVAASCVLDRQLFVWRVEDARLLGQLEDEPYVVLGWTKDGVLMANAAFVVEDGKLKKVRDPDKAFFLLTQDRIFASPDSEEAALIADGITIVNLRHGRHHEWKLPNRPITNLAWTPDKKRVALRYQTGDSVRGPHIRSFVEVRRVSDGALLHSMQVGTSKDGSDTFGTDLSISRDGQWLAISSSAPALHLWDMSGWTTPIPEPPSPGAKGQERH